MLQFTVQAQSRNAFGKGAARQLRREGMTPAVLYGAGEENLSLKLNTKDFTKVLIEIQDQNAVITLNLEGTEGTPERHVLVKEVQVDPVRDELLHTDFFEIDLNKPRTLSVPLRFTGKAKGVDMGGELHINRDSVRLRGKILDIPDYLEVNVAGLGLGDAKKLGDLEIPAGVELQDKADIISVQVYDLSGAAAKAEAVA